jgi:type I restriction enzyme S subunit
VKYPTRRLKTFADVTVSNVDKKSEPGEIPVRLCNYTDVYRHDRIHDDQDFMAATATPDQVERFRLRAGQTLITKDSETADDIGVPAFVESSGPDLLCGYHLAAITPDAAQADARYLFWALKSSKTRDQFTLGASGVTRFGLRSDSIAGLKLPSPALDLQSRIGLFLNGETAGIDELISVKGAMLDLLVEHLRAEVDDAIARFVGEAVPLRRFVL